MTPRFIGDWKTPWPQWRTHWRVWHAWPLSAQIPALFLWTVCAICVGSVWTSEAAWRQWWQASDDLLQTQEDMQRLEQAVMQQRARIDQLRAMPHPAGLALPAWQVWPDDPPPQHPKLMKAWLDWGRQHGLAVVAGKMEDGLASGTWTGSLPQLMAAWHGLPDAVPRLAVVGFEWRAGVAKSPASSDTKPPGLQLQMQWRVWRPPTRSPVSAQGHAGGNQALSASSSDGRAAAVSAPRVVNHIPSAALLYDPFSANGLKKALPRAVGSHAAPMAWQTQALSQMRWAGMLANDHRREALVSTEGQVHSLQLGDRLGQDWGVVTDIGRDHLWLQEWVADSQGKWVSQPRRFPSATSP